MTIATSVNPPYTRKLVHRRSPLVCLSTSTRSASEASRVAAAMRSAADARAGTEPGAGLTGIAGLTGLGGPLMGIGPVLLRPTGIGPVWLSAPAWIGPVWLGPPV